MANFILFLEYPFIASAYPSRFISMQESAILLQAICLPFNLKIVFEDIFLLLRGGQPPSDGEEQEMPPLAYPPFTLQFLSKTLKHKCNILLIRNEIEEVSLQEIKNKHIFLIQN